MAQNTITIADGRGDQVLSELNGAFPTLASLFSGPAAPANPLGYQLWVDTANNLLKQANAAASAWNVVGVFDANQNLYPVNGPAVFASVAALRAWTGAALPVVYLESWHGGGPDGGEGHFVYDPADTTSPDNGGTILVTADGKRYKRALAGQMVTPKMFGAKGDCRVVTDGAMTAGSATLASNTAAFTSADTGKAVSVLGAGAAGATLDATATYVSPTTVTLSAAASTAVTAAWVSLGTDDTAAWQAWLNVVEGGFATGGTPPPGRGGYVPWGRYKITAGLVTTGSYFMPNVLTDGAEYCVVDSWALGAGIAVTLVGGTPGAFGNEWGPMTIDGGATGNGGTGFRSAGHGQYRLRGWNFTNLAVGVELYNSAGAPYTEQFRVSHCHFEGSVATALKYTNATGGTNSFRESGLDDLCTVNVDGTGNVPIYIGQGALPYFAPLDLTLWCGTLANGIIQNANTTFDYGNVSFAGKISVEGAPGAVATGGKVFFAGPILEMGQTSGWPPTGITLGTMVRVKDLTYMATGGIGYGLLDGTFWVHTIANSPSYELPAPAGAPQLSALVCVRCDGPNWYFENVYLVTYTGYDNNARVTQLATTLAFDMNGWGNFTLAASAANDYGLVVSNANWGTTNTVTCTLSVVGAPQSIGYVL